MLQRYIRGTSPLTSHQPPRTAIDSSGGALGVLRSEQLVVRDCWSEVAESWRADLLEVCHLLCAGFEFLFAGLRVSGFASSPKVPLRVFCCCLLLSQSDLFITFTQSVIYFFPADFSFSGRAAVGVWGAVHRVGTAFSVRLLVCCTAELDTLTAHGYRCC